ncbi:hypothetical protein [Actinospica robiniae]|uniref:hypothetical protein n=1 Tax=Actinospica robiniae TaxID=304901 RepID=UPI0004287982|nr:hypothetical protein [Actinospica robiniae]
MTLQNTLRHHRHLVELGSLLATAGAADAFADAFGARRDGVAVLICLGIALIVTTVGHHVWLRRSDHAPPHAAKAAETADALDAAVTGVVWRVRTEIDNTPGRLAVLAGALAAAGANIHGLDAHPGPAGTVVDEFLVETPPDTSAQQLCAAIRAVGGRATRAVPTDLLALVDAPTRALDLAARLARRPDALEAVLADLLEAERVELGPADADLEHLADGTRLVLRGPDGTAVTVSRPGLPFTVVERSRARAVLDLAAAHSAARERGC